MKAQDTVHDVSEEDMADVVAMMTGIPVNKIAESESAKLLKMEQVLKDQVVGQDEAIGKLTKAIRRTRAGLKDPKRPIGSFIFLGPTGVGKTELAKRSPGTVRTDGSPTRIDMSEYMEKFSVSRLVGRLRTVGLRGDANGEVRRQLVLCQMLSIIENAHPTSSNILLQVL